jgi:hypothetical protein
MVFVFLFFVFVAFNRNSASWIISLVAEDGFFFEKSVRTFESLMIVISFNMLYYMCMFIFVKQGTVAERNRILMKFLSGIGILLCVSLYFYAGNFPFTIC